MFWNNTKAKTYPQQACLPKARVINQCDATTIDVCEMEFDLKDEEEIKPNSVIVE